VQPTPGSGELVRQNKILDKKTKLAFETNSLLNTETKEINLLYYLPIFYICFWIIYNTACCCFIDYNNSTVNFDKHTNTSICLSILLLFLEVTEFGLIVVTNPTH
jgi:hypothetical protein